jgi:hypothetical protein
MRIGALAATLIFLSESSGFADHELRKSVFESLGPNAWGMYILLPIPFLALGVIGYFVYRAWRASGSEGSPPSLN